MFGSLAKAVVVGLVHGAVLALALAILVSFMTVNVYALGDFTISANPTFASVNAGVSASSTITLTATGGFTGTINLSDSISPSTGLSCTLTPGSVSLTLLQGTATSALSCSGSAGVYTVTVTGTSGALSHSTTVTVTVMDFSVSASPTTITVPTGTSGNSIVTVAPVNGYTGTITLTDSVSPSGLTCTLTPGSITLGASQTSTLSCSGPTASYTVTVTGTDGSITHTATVTYTVTDFSISASPTSITTNTGTNAPSTITVSPVNGFTGTVTLSSSVSPSSLTCTLNPTSITLGASQTSTLSCSSSTATTYTVTVTGTSGSLTHTATVTYTVQDITITATSPASVNAGVPTSSIITVTAVNGFAGSVSLTDTVPTNLTCGAINPTSVTGSGTATVSCSSTVAGTYILTITGTSGTLSHSTTATFTVRDFSISATSPAASTVGTTTSSTITIIALNGFTGTVSLTDTIPTNLTCGAINPTSITNSGTATVSCSSTVAGTYSLTITGISGALSHSTTAIFTVTDFSITATSPAAVNVGPSTSSTITVTALNGFTGTVSLTDTVPANLTCGAISPTSVTNSGTSTISCSSTMAGTYLLTITGTSGTLSHSTTATFTIVDFTITASSPAPAAAGTSVSSTITVTALNGFSGVVSLTDTVPTNLTCGAISPTSITGSGTATVSCNSTVAATYMLTITGTSGTLTHTATATFTVRDFSIAASSPGAVNAGVSATSTITITALNGFTGTVSLSDTVPANLSCGVTNPTSVTNSGTATVSCSSTIAATYILTITGTSGPLTHSTTATFTITDFTIAASSPAPVNTGVSATSTISVTAVNGFSGVVSLTDTVPANLACGPINPASVTNSGTATVSCSSTTVGTYILTITGTSGSLTHTATATFTVQDFTITITPTTLTILAGRPGNSTITITAANGFGGTISLIAIPSPTTGLTCTLSTTAITGSGTSTLSCSGSTGSYTVTVTATSGTESHPTTVTYIVQDFTIASSPGSVTILAGQSGPSTITITALQGFNGPVSLAETISPASLNCNLLPTGVTSSGSSTLSCNGPVGSYTVTVTATSSTLSHSATVSYSVVDFTIAASPTSATVIAGTPASSTITIAGLNGFTGNVTLLQSVSPSGVTCSLTPTFLLLGVSATSSLSCNGPGGVYTVTVTGTDNGLAHSATATFAVQDFTLVESTNSVTVNAGSQGTETIVAVGLEGFSGTVNLAYTVNPSTGLSCQLAPASIILGTFGTTSLACTGQAGTYALTITGSVNTLSHTLTTTYTVQDFTMSSNSTTLNLNSGSTINSKITLTSRNQFSGTVSLAVDVSPSGLYCSLTPSNIVLSNSATVTLSCTGTTPGTYTVRVTATSGSVSQTSSFTVTESSPPAQTIPLIYFAIMASALGSGGAAALVLKRFRDTDAPFEEFYKIAGGEFLQPMTLLIMGDTGAGTSTLGRELVYKQLAAGKPGGLLTYDAFPAEVEKKMQGLGLDVSSYLKDGKLRIVDCYSALAGNEKAPVRDPLDFTEVSIQVTDLIEKVPTSPITILLDSVTPIFNSDSAKGAINFLQVVGAKVKGQGGVFIFTSTKGSIPEETRSKLEAMVDGVIDLRVATTGDQVKRTLTIKKMSGRKASLVPVEFKIVAGKGILFRRRRFSPREPEGTSESSN